MRVELGRSWRCENQLGPDLSVPEHASSDTTKLEVYVVFTAVRATLAALKTAGELASQLRARLHLLVPHVVPYPCSLDRPAVAIGFTERRFRTLVVGQPHLGVYGVETDVQVQLCRDRKQHLLETLKPNSLAVIGGSRRWFGKDRRLARSLKSHGVHVIFVGI